MASEMYPAQSGVLHLFISSTFMHMNKHIHFTALGQVDTRKFTRFCLCAAATLLFPSGALHMKGRAETRKKCYS